MSISWDSSLVKRMEPRLRVMPEMLWRRFRVMVSSVEEREAEASSLSRSFACKGGELVSCWQRNDWRVVSQSAGLRVLRFERSLEMREVFTGLGGQWSVRSGGELQAEEIYLWRCRGLCLLWLGALSLVEMARWRLR